MAEVHNPLSSAVFCHPLHRVIKPHGTVQITNAQARLISPNIFVVTLDDEPEPETKPTRKSRKAATRTTGVQGVTLEDKGMTLSGTGDGVAEPWRDLPDDDDPDGEDQE